MKRRRPKESGGSHPEAPAAREAADGPGALEARVAELEHALAESERERREAAKEAERYRALQEQASDAIVLAGGDGRIQEVNRAALELLRLEPDELASLTIRDLVHPDDLAQAPFDVNAVMAGYVVRNQRHLLRRDGSSVLCETSTKRVGDSVQVIARDVSERERMTSELLRETAHVRLLQEVAVAANQAPSFGAALATCLERVCRTTHWPVGHVYVPPDEVGEDTERLVPSEVWHLEDPERYTGFREASGRIAFRRGEGLVGRVFDSGRADWLVDASRAPGFLRAEAAAEAGLRSALAVPVLAGEEVAAVLEFFSPRGRPPDARMLDLVRHVGTQLGRLVERERARKELAGLAERLELALRSAQYGVWSWSSRENRFRGDGRTQELFGVESPCPVGDVHRRLRGEDAARVRATDFERLRAGTEFHEELRVPGPPERVVTVRGQVHRDARGELTHLAGLCWDVTESYRAQEALRRAHEENRRLLQTLPAALIAVDAQERVLRWNERASELLGIPAETALGRPLLSLGLPLPAEPIRSALREATEGGDAVRLPELELQSAGGRGGFLDLSVNPVALEGSDGLLLVATDITEIKALQEASARARRLESIGRLAAGVAHEINTPLQFLSDNTRFLERAVAELCQAAEKGPGALEDADRAFLVAECPRALAQTREGLEQVSKIVGSMRHLAQGGRLRRTSVALDEAVEEVLILTRSEWKHVAEVETRLEPELPAVQGYAREIRQALLNLVVNAAHAIADRDPARGGRGRIAIEAERAGERIRIRVRDDGTGIAEADRAHVFDPFFSTKAPGRGTGQGLTIVHDAVVEKHGGAIRIESEPGVGTTVHLEIPIEAQPRSG